MSSKWLISSIIALSCALTPFMASAKDNSAQPETMPKDAWLNEMKPQLPSVVCKGFIEDAELKKRFDEVNLNYVKCVSLIPDIAAKCQTEIYDKIPAIIDEANANTWGSKLGECIGKSFAEEYLVPKE